MSERGAFRLREASQYIGLGPKSNWLLDPACPVPKCDLRKPGALRPTWVWLKRDLDAFIESRRVAPGMPNPQDY